MRESIRWAAVAPGVEVMAVAHSTRLYRVVLDSYMVGELARGRVEWRARGATRTQGAGDLVFGEPGELYASHRHGAPGTWNALFIAAPIVEQAAAELGIPGAAPHLRAAQARDLGLSRALARFHRVVAAGGTALERDEQLSDCVRRLVQGHAERRPAAGRHATRANEPVAVRRAREFLHAQVATPVSLDELAGAAGVSKYHLVRAFRRAVGVPPHAYQVLLRVGLARRLIATGQAFSHVALVSGFAAQSHLNRHFTRVVGVTPGAFRRASMELLAASKIVEDPRGAGA